MEPAIDQTFNEIDKTTRKRPLLCGLILTMALTYFLVLFLLFASGLVFHHDLVRAVGHYYKPEEFKESAILWFTLAGTLLFAGCSAGIVLFLLKRRIGFYLFFSTALVIFILDLILLDFDLIRYLIHSGFFFMLGLMHFSKRCYF